MTQPKLVKGVTLCSSILLVILFLCYRAGFIPDFMQPTAGLQTSPNGSAITTNTTPAKEPQKNVKRILPSSKSIVLTGSMNPRTDSSKRKIAPKTPLTERRILSSSKSAILIKERPHTNNYKYYRYNIVNRDSLKRQ